MQDEKTRLKRNARRAYLKMLDAARLNVPPHLADRIGKPSKLAESLTTVCEYGWKGTCFTENGEPLERTDARVIREANSKRHMKSVERARRLRDKYPGHWRTRFGASVIAARERVSAKTIRRYFSMKLDIEERRTV